MAIYGYDDGNDPGKTMKSILHIIVVSVISIVLSGMVRYNIEQKRRAAEKPVYKPLFKGIDTTKDAMDIYMITNDLEVIYNDDPRLNSMPPKKSVRHYDTDELDYSGIDFSDPEVVEQIFETADFYDLYERYAD